MVLALDTQTLSICRGRHAEQEHLEGSGTGGFCSCAAVLLLLCYCFVVVLPRSRVLRTLRGAPWGARPSLTTSVGAHGGFEPSVGGAHGGFGIDAKFFLKQSCSHELRLIHERRSLCLIYV
jgi:hypothetical protein